MKKLLITLICLMVLSCKTDKKQTESNQEVTKDRTDNELTLNGNFIYYDKAAVLQTRDEIYGVIVDSMLLVLDNQANAFKKEATDMIAVKVRAKLYDKKDNTEWKKKIEILEVIEVLEPKPEDNQVIKLQ